jgi:hypothetical protein
MTDIPSSLKITREEANRRFAEACAHLVGVVGCPRIASRLGVHRSTVRSWSLGLHEASYWEAMYIIAWDDMERSIEDGVKTQQNRANNASTTSA